LALASLQRRSRCARRPSNCGEARSPLAGRRSSTAFSPLFLRWLPVGPTYPRPGHRSAEFCRQNEPAILSPAMFPDVFAACPEVVLPTPFESLQESERLGRARSPL